MRGELCTVITTDALELGIDIGELDAAVVVTFPGTVASLRQMWGRAGRRGRGLAVYVAGEDALDQFFCRHPEDFLERPVEAAILDHESPLIYRAHLLCAAHEGPLSRGDAEFLGPRWEAHAEILQSSGELRRRERAIVSAYVPGRPGSYPAAEVSLRSASPESFAIVDVCCGELLGSTEAARAHSTVHDGAIYMHQGRSYEVRELDLERDARSCRLSAATGTHSRRRIQWVRSRQPAGLSGDRFRHRSQRSNYDGKFPTSGRHPIPDNNLPRPQASRSDGTEGCRLTEEAGKARRSRQLGINPDSCPPTAYAILGPLFSRVWSRYKPRCFASCPQRTLFISSFHHQSLAPNYSVFGELRAAGVIPAGMRFQVACRSPPAR